MMIKSYYCKVCCKLKHTFAIVKHLQYRPLVETPTLCPRFPGILPLVMMHNVKDVIDKNTTLISETCQYMCSIMFGVTLTKIFSVITNA
jgi:hypothetical protein